MDITLVLKVLGLGMLIAVSGQILSKTGRDEQGIWLTIAGIVSVRQSFVRWRCSFCAI